MGFFDRLTGRTVEEKVNEYGEIYGEILLGMHRDLQEHRAAIKNHERSMQQGIAELDEFRAKMTKDAAKLQDLVLEAKAHKDSASKCGEAASVALQVALKAAASADSAAGRSDRRAAECCETAKEVEQSRRAFITRVEEQEQQLQNLRTDYQKFRRRVIWFASSGTALAIVGVITWILHLRA